MIAASDSSKNRSSMCPINNSSFSILFIFISQLLLFLNVILIFCVS
jgi:hypothetical protein